MQVGVVLYCTWNEDSTLGSQFLMEGSTLAVLHTISLLGLSSASHASDGSSVVNRWEYIRTCKQEDKRVRG